MLKWWDNQCHIVSLELKSLKTMLHLIKLAKIFLPFYFSALWRLSHSYSPSHAQCIFNKPRGSVKLGRHPGRLGEDSQAERVRCREALLDVVSPRGKTGCSLKACLPVAQHQKFNLCTGNWEVTVKTYYSDLIWFYYRLLWFKKATEMPRTEENEVKTLQTRNGL